MPKGGISSLATSRLEKEKERKSGTRPGRGRKHAQFAQTLFSPSPLQLKGESDDAVNKG
jgi:hypothetical protein